MAGWADEKYADSTKQRAATVPRNLVKTWNSQKILLQFFSTESVTWVIVTNVVPPQIKAYLKKFSKKSVTVLFNWIGDEGDCYKCGPPTNQEILLKPEILKNFCSSVLFNWIGDEGDCYKCGPPTNQGVHLKELAGQEFDGLGVFCFKLTNPAWDSHCLGGGGLKPQMS